MFAPSQNHQAPPTSPSSSLNSSGFEPGFWTRTLRPASWKGATFHVESTATTFGRKSARHEFPLRDLPYIEDLGRQAREFTIEGWFAGPNWESERDALIRCAEEASPGKLVHPRLGEVDCHLISLTVREENNKGMWAEFSATFVEAGAVLQPKATLDTGRTLTTTLGGVLRRLPQLLNLKLTLALPGVPTMSWPDFVIRGLEEWKALFKGAASKHSSKTDRITPLLTGAALGEAVVAVIRDLGSNAPHALKPFLDFGDPIDLTTGVSEQGKVFDISTPSMKAIPVRTNALNDLVRETALIEVIRQRATLTQPSFEEALVERDQILDRLDRALTGAADGGDFERHALLAQVKADFVTHSTAQIVRLARQVEKHVPVPTSALLVAHNFFDDLSYADEIVERNGIDHPGYITQETIRLVLP